jgi:hypothetical protein
MNRSNNIIKYARLAYSNSWNLGDHIQTLATEQFLGDNLISIERDKIDQYKGEKVLLLMQGYFFLDKHHCSFPPSDDIIPVFIGFHIEATHKTASLYGTKEFIEYIKKYEPIGCRDDSTKNFLLEHGVNAYLSRCLTLTFLTRENHIKGNKIFFIDEPKWMKSYIHFLGKRFRKMYDNGVFLTQVVDAEPVGILPDSLKRQIAIDRINLLKKDAKLVITSRLHVASPCVAMGIPVLLFPEESTGWERYGTLRGIIPIYTFSLNLLKKFGKFHSVMRNLIRIIYVRFFINWNPIFPDVKNLKAEMIQNVQNTIKKTIDKYNN